MQTCLLRGRALQQGTNINKIRVLETNGNKGEHIKDTHFEWRNWIFVLIHIHHLRSKGALNWKFPLLIRSDESVFLSVHFVFNGRILRTFRIFHWNADGIRNESMVRQNIVWVGYTPINQYLSLSIVRWWSRIVTQDLRKSTICARLTVDLTSENLNFLELPTTTTEDYEPSLKDMQFNWNGFNNKVHENVRFLHYHKWKLQPYKKGGGIFFNIRNTIQY